MNHWLLVGQDLWWFLRWPIMCGLWAMVGIAKSERSDGAFMLVVLAIGFTLIVANT